MARKKKVMPRKMEMGSAGSAFWKIPSRISVANRPVTIAMKHTNTEGAAGER